MTDHIAVQCLRCYLTTFPERREDLRGWLFIYLPDDREVEHLIGAICPGCTTDEDTAEAVVREATEDIDTASTVTRISVRPKDVNA